MLLIIICLLIVCCAFTHRRVIKALISHEEMPKAPKWHFWVKPKTEEANNASWFFQKEHAYGKQGLRMNALPVF